jgi:hypothetical protein
MITDEIVKTNFTVETLTEEARIIKLLQAQVVIDWNMDKDTGTHQLLNSMKGHFSVNSFSEGCALTLSYVKYTRFLDIPNVALRRKGLHIYNKIVFGRIYGTAIPRLRYGFLDEVKSRIYYELQQSMSENPFLKKE